MKINKETIIQAAAHLEQTLIMKNHDYGNSVEEQYNEYGLTSLLIRCEDKLRRLKAKEGDYQVDETVAETFLDLAGYSLLAYIIHAYAETPEVNPFAKELEQLIAENKLYQKEIQKYSARCVDYERKLNEDFRKIGVPVNIPSGLFPSKHD